MSEQLQTRTEHSRSIADAERYQATEALKELGALTSLSELDVYHGRAWRSDEADAWSVNPDFANGGNDSGNLNVNNRPTLYTAQREIAQEFADNRAGFRGPYTRHLRAIIDSYSPEQKAAQLERQNAHNKRLWEESGKTWQLDVWDLEKLENSNSFVEIHHLKDQLGTDYYEKFKQQHSGKVRGDVHKIVSTDSDALVANLEFNPHALDEEGKTKYREALKALVIPVTEGSPLDFQDRKAVSAFVDTLKGSGLKVIGALDIALLAEQSGLKESTVLQLAAASNSRYLALINPSALVRKFLEDGGDMLHGAVSVADSNGNERPVPISHEYIARYLRLNHIVGVNQAVYSATLGKSLTAVSLFDLEKVNTEEAIDSQRASTAAQLGAVATLLSESIQRPFELERNQLFDVISNPHATPESIMAAAKEVSGFGEIYELDAGNWEGFTLAEHTETVLRNFDETYADSVPVQLIAPMRLAILAHDLGKPIAVKEGNRAAQKEYNIEFAQKFFNEVGVDSQLNSLLVAALGIGQAHAFKVDIRRDGDAAKNAFRNFAEQTLADVYGADSFTKEQVDGFVEFCSMLQVCDGGAYTSTAVTRKNTGGRHRNAPSFNKNFQPSKILGDRAVRLKKGRVEG